MRRFIPLLLAAALSLPSIAAASSTPAGHTSGPTKWALFGLGGKHINRAPKAAKAPKAPKARHSSKAGKPARRAKSAR